jgi:hypothetical protein
MIRTYPCILFFIFCQIMPSLLSAQKNIKINGIVNNNITKSEWEGKTTLLIEGNFEVEGIRINGSIIPYDIYNSESRFISNTTVVLDKVYDETIDIKVSEKKTIKKSFKTTTTSSVLGTGDWYKINIVEDGLFRIDKAFIQSMGLDPNNINPNQVRIFGHYGGMLPLRSGDTPIDDLREIPVLVNSTNNKFEDNDYITFYAQGHTVWQYDATRNIYRHTKSLYSDYKCYFININNTNSLKIDTKAANNAVPTEIITTYKDRAYYESNLYNLLRSGAQWVGEEFTSSSGLDYNFNFSNIDNSSTAYITTALVARSTYSSSSFQIYANNNLLGNSNINSVGVSEESIYANYNRSDALYTNPTNNIVINIKYQRPDFDARAWVDFVEANVTRKLIYEGTPLYFRKNATANTLTKFVIENANSSLVLLDVSDPFNVIRIPFNGSDFADSTTAQKEYVLFSSPISKPNLVGKIENQNLHQLANVPYLIITTKALMPFAQELSDFHLQQEGLQSHVVDVEQIYNEFSSGNRDVSAVRNFIKMFYDRAAGNSNVAPKYVLMFGDGFYDFKSENPYYLAAYESLESRDPIDSYVSDDFFACLDDAEGADINNTFTHKLDVAIGRIPADNAQKATIAIQKIKDYYNSFSFGDWRNQVTFMADDGDGVTHINDADRVAKIVENNYKKYNVDKIYSDAYSQQSNSGGARYPDVNAALANKMFSGTFFVDYAGHGGSRGLADEQILTFNDINSWQNKNKLPIFITATCEFTRYDEGDYVAGERLFFKEDGGAIALVSTVRLVYANENFETNKNFISQLMLASESQNITLGEVIYRSKNITNTREGNRKFSLFGDPALKLAFPKYNIVTTKINGQNMGSIVDTLKALDIVTIEAEIQDTSGVLINNFNGIAYTTIFDKNKRVTTLQNDPESGLYSFDLRKNILFRGKATVVNGKFNISFIIPKDIDYNFGLGKISHYASNETVDAAGQTFDIYIGGISENIVSDNQAPKVNIFLDDKSFSIGSITSSEPLLIADFFDENGINISGSGIGHDITAIIDEDSKSPIVLNNFYESNANDYTTGSLQFPMSKLDPGRHQLRVKAWDNYNNSGEDYTEFIVEDNAALALSHVLNYPNPFTTNTEFIFEHNRIGNNLILKIDIFTITGRLVKSINANMNSVNKRVDNIFWDGKDEFGDNLAKGVYIYKLSVKDNNGESAQEFQKLVLLRQ